MKQVIFSFGKVFNSHQLLESISKREEYLIKVSNGYQLDSVVRISHNQLFVLNVFDEYPFISNYRLNITIYIAMICRNCLVRSDRSLPLVLPDIEHIENHVRKRHCPYIIHLKGMCRARSLFDKTVEIERERKIKRWNQLIIYSKRSNSLSYGRRMIWTELIFCFKGSRK